MATYNGHKNWNHWNVSLWIGNDEGLYGLARHCLRVTDNRDDASTVMLEDLIDRGITETPDGAPYTFTTVRAALRGI